MGSVLGLRPREVPPLAQSHTARRGSAWPGARVCTIISDFVDSSEWVAPCWFHSLPGCPGLLFLQLGERACWGGGGGNWCRGENRKCQLIHISKCHVIPGAFSLCHHLHPPTPPPPAVLKEERSRKAGYCETRVWGLHLHPVPWMSGGVGTVLGIWERHIRFASKENKTKQSQAAPLEILMQ